MYSKCRCIWDKCLCHTQLFLKNNEINLESHIFPTCAWTPWIYRGGLLGDFGKGQTPGPESPDELHQDCVIQAAGGGSWGGPAQAYCTTGPPMMAGSWTQGTHLKKRQ